MKTFTISIVVCCISCCFASPPPDLNDIYAKWKLNYASQKINKVIWSRTLLKNAPGPATQGWTPIQFYLTELIKDGNNVLLREAFDANGFSGKARTTITDGKIKKTYDSAGAADKNQEYSGFLTLEAGTMRPKVNEALECMLLTPCICPPGATRCPDYLLDNSFEAGFELKTIKLAPNMETILGHPCYVVELGGPFHKVWFAPDLGMLPLKYFKAHPDTGVVYDEIDIQKVNSVKTSKVFGGMREVSIYRQSTPQLGDLTRTIRVLSMEPEFPITKDTFNPRFPDDTLVIDKINKTQYKLGMHDVNSVNNRKKIQK